jgi:hypothetical protein
MLMLLIILVASTIPAYASADAGIEARITSAMEFVVGQYSNISEVNGYLRGTGQTADSQRMYSEDAGLVTLSLAFYKETHATQFQTDRYLKYAVNFLLNAQTSSGDFYEYYDQGNHTWQNGGKLYPWNAYVLMGIAYAGYVASIQSTDEKAYWTSVVDRLLLTVNTFFSASQLPSGAFDFHFLDGKDGADLESNGALLVGLIYMALFEHYLGDTDESTRLAVWSEGIAHWLLSQQEFNDKTWGIGGFYHNSTRTLQLTYENGIAMFGLLSYYKGIGVLLGSFQPTISEARQSMIVWAGGFFARIIDAWGGPRVGRSGSGNITYPKTTLEAASLAQAMGDVWIDIGSYRGGKPDYWTDASKPFQWIIGANERSTDLQQAKSLQGTGLGFYTGIENNRTIEASDLTSTALALYAILKVDQIGVAEISDLPILAFVFVAIPLVVLRYSRRARGGLGGDSKSFQLLNAARGHNHSVRKVIGIILAQVISTEIWLHAHNAKGELKELQKS